MANISDNKFYFCLQSTSCKYIINRLIEQKKKEDQEKTTRFFIPSKRDEIVGKGLKGSQIKVKIGIPLVL